ALAVRHRLRSASPYASADVARQAAARAVPTVDWAQRRGPLVRELARQAFYTSMPALLRYADRNSMAHSREVRLPFLDHRVAEYALSLPTTFLYSHGTSKRVLREALQGVVPEQILSRRDKVGFQPPQAAWLSSPGGIALARDVLLDDAARSRPFYDTAAIERDLGAGRWRDVDGVWRALSVELWLAVSARDRARGV